MPSLTQAGVVPLAGTILGMRKLEKVEERIYYELLRNGYDDLDFMREC